MEDRNQGWWQNAPLLWIYSARPTDFPDMGYRRLCLGLNYLPGLFGLFLYQWVCFAEFFHLVFRYGFSAQALLPLIPVALLFLFCVPADIRFRRQRPTAYARSEFEVAFVNECGVANVFVFWGAMIVGLLGGVGYGLYHLLMFLRGWPA
jgi:hypothetical protein